MSRVLVLGAGLVGRELARRLTAEGHDVVATTTTPGKVDALREVTADVRVLRGSDTAAVAEAARGCDVIVVCAGPNAQRSMSAEERVATYTEVLVETADSVVAAATPDTYLVALSSLSVHGDAADAEPVITEDSPLTTSDDASPRSFQAMERTYLGRGNACVFRCADIYGADDPPIEAKVGMAHTILGGSVPFSGEALFYRVHVEDVIGAIEHAVRTRITGVYNLTHADVPATNRERFDAIGAQLGHGPLQFRDEIAGPARPVSVDKLAATGFTTSHTKVEVVA